MPDPTILVLASLADGEKHGYAIMEDVHGFANVRLGPGTLYGAITRLEQRGWIRPVDSVDRRRPYRITGAGREHLEGPRWRGALIGGPLPGRHPRNLAARAAQPFLPRSGRTELPQHLWRVVRW